MCGGRDRLEVHHIRPFHLYPALELDPANFVTLCEALRECHLQVGHLGNWFDWNRALLAKPPLAHVAGSTQYTGPSPTLLH